MMATSAADAFTGTHLDVQDVITSGDKVVVRFTNSGTTLDRSWVRPPPDVVPNGSVSASTSSPAAGSRKPDWRGEDVLGMLLQLEAVTLPTAA
ncbi:ester cyclase [Streptomyces sp. uw30]|uniref:ester cyclase n=1 Tax=Streptomyces sp. uw30 TaxID=1828179 RepID=UPI0011CECA08|nr:ester cyclase [Streptomyces sp. uw30]